MTGFALCRVSQDHILPGCFGLVPIYDSLELPRPHSLALFLNPHAQDILRLPYTQNASHYPIRVFELVTDESEH